MKGKGYMNKLKEIKLQIKELEEEMNNVEGTEAEVYSRIVGYYRPIKQWNPGKKEEYKERKLFLNTDKFPEKYKSKVEERKKEFDEKMKKYKEKLAKEGKMVCSIKDKEEI